MFTNKERLYYIKARLLLGSFNVCLVFSGSYMYYIKVYSIHV